MLPQFLVLLTMAGPPDPGAVDSARRCYTDGEAAFADGRFVDAIRAFEEGYRFVPRPVFLLDIGHAWRRLGDLRRARASYRKFQIVDPESPRHAEVAEVLHQFDLAIAEEDVLGSLTGSSAPAEAEAAGGAVSSANSTVARPTNPRATLLLEADALAPEQRGPVSRWWFWAAIGTALAGGTVAVLALRRDHPESSDGTLGTLRR